MPWRALIVLAILPLKAIAADEKDVVKEFFYGHEVVRVMSENSDTSKLARDVAAKVAEYGLNAMNIKDHGFRTYRRFAELKGSNLVPVIYFDVRVYPVNSGTNFSFDMKYWRADDIYQEEQPGEILKDCKARTDWFGGIQLRLNECIAKSAPEV